ncbi:MAG: glucuronate isomerase [Clostridiales bacterium]|nr:glucuronate isomerase [Clostridiales bacterium]
MKPFLDKDFLLETPTAQHLYHDYVEGLPLVDYHCHISPKEIYEDRRFDNLAEVWLGGDHYKWRVMRSNGISEDYITGDKPAFERFQKFAESLELCIGNPMYHWCHLELKNYFGFEGHLTGDNAKEVWDLCNDKLRNDPNFTARGLIRQSNVAMIGTTDDPVDSLEWHQKIAADPTFETKVCPSFRPDKALNLHKAGFADYIAQLSAVVGRELTTAQDVADALVERIEYFHANGCRAADHGLDYVMYRPCTPEEADAAYHKALAGEKLTIEEIEGYQTTLLLACARAYARLGIAMQLHYSCIRNPNARMFAQLGPDTGYDIIANTNCTAELAALLSDLDATGECPKTILYSLNPADNAQLDVLIGAFQGTEVPGKIQHGSAWWFNDNRAGMVEQMTSLANLSLLGNFIGMLTDSRSFLSYTRHEYFRRVMCNLIGGWVENGEYPNDEKALKKIVQGISYYNAARYFDL